MQRAFHLNGRKEWLAAGGVVILALLLRIVYVFEMRASPAFEFPTMDALYHLEWARALAAGDRFAPGPFFRAPLYVGFLATLFKLFGENLLLARVFQAFLGAATTGLVFLLGRRVFDARVGLIASLFTATYWVLIYFDGELLIPTLAVPLNLLALWLSLGLGRQATPRASVLAGMVWGLSAIARPNVLLFMPLLALWLFFKHRPDKRAGVVATALLTAGVMIPILPITAYNRLVGDDWVLIASQGGVNFYIGNNPWSNGSTAVVPGTRGGWWEGYHDTIALAEASEGRELRPSEVSRFYSRLAWQFILSSPSHSIPLLLYKLRLFWLDLEIENNQSIHFAAHRFSRLVNLLPLRFGVLAPLGLLGLAVSVGRNPRSRFLSAFMLVYMASVVAFFVCSRYRVPVLPVLMIFAAHAVCWIGEAVQSRRYSALAVAALGIAGGMAFSFNLPDSFRTTDSNGYLYLGNAERARGNFAEAEAHLRRSVELDEQNLSASTQLAILLRDTGRHEEAIADMEAALEGNRPRVQPLELLIELQFANDGHAEVESLAQIGIEHFPSYESFYYYLGRLRALQWRFEEAEALFAAAQARAPRSFRSAYERGQACKALGLDREAIVHFEIAAANVARAQAWEIEPLFAELRALLRAADEKDKLKRYSHQLKELRAQH